MLRDLGKEYPSDEGAKRLATDKDCYTGWEAECRYLLWRYEEELARKAGHGVDEAMQERIWRARSAAETIEHIYPQNPERGGAWSRKLKRGRKVEECVHRIGNLILLPPRLNETVGRLPFPEKLAEYRKVVGLRLVRRIVENQRDWNLDAIERRSEEIADWARTAWDDVRD